MQPPPPLPIDARMQAIHSRKAWAMLEQYLIGTLEVPSASSLARSVSPVGGALGLPEAKTSGDDDVALRGKGKSIQCRLVFKEYESPDVLRLRFALPQPEQRLGLPVGMHIGLRAVVDGEKVMRQYTPVSDGDEKGHVELLVKVL
jgi:nitrate reductase (NAD(P)H)